MISHTGLQHRCSIENDTKQLRMEIHFDYHDCWQARHRHEECARWCRAKTPLGVEVRHTLEVVGEVRRSQAVEAAVDENCQFVVNPLTHPQPVQLTKKRCLVVVPPWWVDQPGGGIQHELQPIDLVCRKTDECGTAVIESWQNHRHDQEEHCLPRDTAAYAANGSVEEQQSSSTQSSRRDLMEVSKVHIDAQILYGGGGGYEVLADPHRSLWNLMLSPTRGAPEDFRHGGVELESIA